MIKTEIEEIETCLFDKHGNLMGFRGVATVNNIQHWGDFAIEETYLDLNGNETTVNWNEQICNYL